LLKVWDTLTLFYTNYGACSWLNFGVDFGTAHTQCGVDDLRDQIKSNQSGQATRYESSTLDASFSKTALRVPAI
jgi:hypothetical protein